MFEFSDVGYVKDDEKDSLDANALLDSIKDSTLRGNQERMKRGWPTMTILGWETPPRYNDTHPQSRMGHQGAKRRRAR